ncbi:MAG: isoleucine--tRNA ligase [Phycisphaera sp.]|nr:isoleucine--tRNA ligase [Phycisphaera sp.]
MSEQTQQDKPSYKKTLNPRNTSFAMKANLVQREPEFQKRWDRLGVYKLLRERAEGKPRYVLHDGPPYANGSIHLGHLLNKVLKDLVVRSRNMLGYDAPFIPGWDCHGLPIEHKVMQELGDKAKDMVAPQIRKRCHDYADKYVKLQAKQMQRLGTMGDYDEPYLTMKPSYEAATLEVFADLVGKGLVYRSLKPVHWSIENQTALADAELEYYDREDTSVYVLFEIANPQDLPSSLNARPGEGLSLMIWTTTPWTLPANLAVAAAPSAEYGLYRWESNGRMGLTIVACDLADKVFDMADAFGDLLGTCTGAELEAAKIRYKHPFIDRVSPVVTADYVTLEDGTGLVHTAPGHGVEDYQTGLAKCLSWNSNTKRVDYVITRTITGAKFEPKPTIYCPVLPDGTFDDSVPDWLQGKTVWEANDLVTEHLRESGHLLHDLKFGHSYPHDWRSKTPVIFRATEQWFIAVTEASTERAVNEMFVSYRQAGLDGDAAIAAVKKRMPAASLRQLALDATKDRVKFIPDWGRNRMRGMLDSRPDWCISRQRSWGLPIPALFPPEGFIMNSASATQPYPAALLTEASVRAVAKVFDRNGSDYWFTASIADLYAEYDPLSDPDAPQWLKDLGAPDQWESTLGVPLTRSRDIFDVWFESGSSWNAVIRQRLGVDQVPVDLYLEGSDQHRGWFQLSLLPAIGVTGGAPFKTVLTHGFMVDKDGLKYSKSKGHTIDDLFTKYGVDVLRWWVAGQNTDNDIKVDDSYFDVAGEQYRKVRNTIRFLLMNLEDFDPAKDRREIGEADAATIDGWVMGELSRVIGTVRGGYESYQFRRVHEAVYSFCNEELSAVYLAATKDRLYCDKADSDRRRRTQTAMYDIAEALIRMIAPVMVHTADEAWLALHGKDAKADDDCVHMHTLPEPIASQAGAAWGDVLALRDRALKVLEDARQQMGIDNPLDAGITVALPADKREAYGPYVAELPDVCGVSRFTLVEGDAEAITIDDLREEPRCDRSWKRDGTVKPRSDGGTLSDRDAEAVGV